MPRKKTGQRVSAPDDVEDLLRDVRARFLHVRKNSPGAEQVFLDHLRSVARFHEPLKYVRTRAPKFPVEVPITFAVCQASCGNRQFLVEGGTQECDYCGALMFRTTAPVLYRRVDEPVRARRSPRASLKPGK